MLASMAPGLPFAIAAQLAWPDRQSVAIVGDGGFAMLMAELSTAVAQKLPVKIILLKNNSLAELMFEQRDRTWITPSVVTVVASEMGEAAVELCAREASNRVEMLVRNAPQPPLI
jgi:thiamine pyrophosphate-dependent acetolactate synthase large subunit-like protein